MRVRLRFTKLGKVRFTGHRDVARMWERALRRAALPLTYSEGFSPRPQLSFGLALPTGCESLAEYLDVALDEHRWAATGLVVPALPALLTGLLPAGIEVEEAALVERAEGSLQQQVTSCSWTLQLSGVAPEELEVKVATLLAARTVPLWRERKGRQELDDLRPSVLALAVSGAFGPVAGGCRTVGLVAELATQPRGVRPSELMRGLIAGPGPAPLPLSQETAVGGTGAAGGVPGDGVAGTLVLDRACRTEQWIERDGDRQEPLGRTEGASGAGRATHALGRAS